MADHDQKNQAIKRQEESQHALEAAAQELSEEELEAATGAGLGKATYNAILSYKAARESGYGRLASLKASAGAAKEGLHGHSLIEP